MSAADPVTVVVPNFNGRRLLPGVLEALCAQTRPPAAVVVVDNGSVDGSAELAERVPGVEVVRRADNGGFGAAANAGLARCRTPNLAVLNSDARPEPTWLQALAEDGPSGTDVWAWGSVLVSSATGLVESAGDFVHANGMSGKYLARRPLSELPTEPYEVLAPPGAAPLLRADVVRELGGWFEPYFLYYEDLDLAMRARLAGYRAHIVPRARVVHDLGGSSGGRPPWDHIARSSTWCTIRTNPRLDATGFARLHLREFRIARRHGGAGQWCRGKARSLPAIPRRLVERREIMRTACDTDWTPGPPPTNSDDVTTLSPVRTRIPSRLRRRDRFVTNREMNGPRLVRARLWWRTRRNGSLLQAPLRITGPGAAHALDLISIAPGTRIGQFAWFSLVSRDASVRIGSGCTLSASMSISVKSSVEIADGTAIGERVLITDHGHDHMTYLEAAIDGTSDAPEFGWGITEGRPVVIGPGVHIGANVFVGPGVTVGEGSVIGVNSVVTKSVRPYTIVAGIPAREIRSLRPDEGR